MKNKQKNTKIYNLIGFKVIYSGVATDKRHLTTLAGCRIFCYT